MKQNRLYLLLGLAAGILLALLIFAVITMDKTDPTVLKMIEDGELRTGPQAAYPVVFKVEKGERLDIYKHDGKWYYVGNDKKKGWIAGWHTDLDIEPDKLASAEPFKGKTIILDPGHGGSDQGASSRKGTLEKDITLKTALMLRDKLKKEGAKVIMTRDEDQYVKLGDRKAAGDVFISLHSDALTDTAPHGLTVYYNQESQKALADTLHFAINKKTLLSDRGVRQENYQVIRQTKMPAVLLELGYISNPTDERLMNDKIHRQTVTTAIVDGLRNYFIY
ncbi:cell wall amidase [Macrococcus hajekii]|uniref:Cell wall amidase n=1 Tax=Macrococcus hajekii TaxID=198482 RepID=A0A4V3BEF8_9STAP|nr:N-acetylmuramoyl-L-alanine amidase [Macrococcus hajekii]TDM02825.1 cell wall amidase [Macrococcus hajekii]GGB04198.1 putative cell wall amidase LytH [Macrococcus hajekii]